MTEIPTTAYVIHDADIHDPGRYGAFMGQAKPLVEAFGGRYPVRVGAHEVLEGTWEPTPPALFVFPDMESARKLFQSATNPPFKAFRE